MTEFGKWEPIKNKNSFAIENPSHEMKNIRFKIYPDTGKVLPASTGFEVLEYKIMLREMVP